MRRFGLLLIAGVLAQIESPDEAEACSQPPQLSEGRFLAPATGATGVPTNARLIVGFWGSETLAGYQVELRTAGGDVVTAVTRTIRRSDLGPGVLVTPATALAPSSTYELYDNAQLPCFVPGACFGLQLAPIASFTTGAGPDTTPPTFDFAPTLTTTHDVCDDSACCGPHDLLRISLSWAAATDQHTVLYDVRLQGETEPLIEGAVAQAHGAVSCPSSSSTRVDELAGNGTYVVSAVDLSGNATEGAPFVVQVTCPVVGGPDGGATPDAGSAPATPDDDGGGCGCRVGARQDGDAPVLLSGLVLLGLAVSRRRRRRRGDYVLVSRAGSERSNDGPG